MNQCSGSGSFWAFWIRIHTNTVHTDPDPFIDKQKNRENLDFYSFVISL
jgi:hypothetical protein